MSSCGSCTVWNTIRTAELVACRARTLLCDHNVMAFEYTQGTALLNVCMVECIDREIMSQEIKYEGYLKHRHVELKTAPLFASAVCRC